MCEKGSSAIESHHRGGYFLTRTAVVMSGYVSSGQRDNIKLIEVCTLRGKLRLYPLPLTNLGL